MPATKNLAMIFALCVLGLLLYALTGDPDYTGPEEIPSTLQELATLETDRVDRLTISAGENTVSLHRDGNTWRSPSLWGYAADGAKVDALLGQLGELRGFERRGTSESSHATFQVDAESGWRLRLEGEGEPFPVEITLGKIDTYDRVFLRGGDAPEVYSVQPNLRFGAGLSGELRPTDWLDLVMVSIDESHAITGFRWEDADGIRELRQVTLETTTPAPDGEVGEPATTVVWQVVEPETFDADPAGARALRSSVRRILAGTAADPAGIAGYGLEPPERTLTVSIDSGDPVVVEIGSEVEIDETRQGMYARRRGDDRVFILPDWTVNTLFRDIETLRPADPDPASPESGPPPAPAPDPPGSPPADGG